MDIIILVIILLISLCELFGQSCLQYFHINNDKPHYYMYAVIFYSAVCLLLVQSYKYKGMGIINVLWSGLSILLVLSASTAFFGEKITVMDKVGIVLIIMGMFLILYEGDHNIEKFIK
jgi:multidrug transporter EmrE-like cation transporter